MKQLSVLLALALVMALPLAVRADEAPAQWEEPVVLVAAVERMLDGGGFIVGLEPGASLDAVAGAGVPLAVEPSVESVSEDGLLTSAGYALDDSAIVVCNREVALNPLLQFVNGGFTGIDLVLPDGAATDDMAALLNELLGDAETTELEAEGLIVAQWQVGEGAAEASVSITTQSDEAARATLSVSYVGYMQQLRESAQTDE